MTDTERERITAICEIAGVTEIDDLSDGFHTFRQLYYQRMMLFAAIVRQNKDKAWKSLRHEDGELCFGGGWFIVGIDTPEGSYTYHYENKYFDLFDCEILDYGKHWDGHTEKDVTRLLSLPKAQLSKEDTTSDLISRQWLMECVNEGWIKFDTEKDENRFIHLVRDIAPSAQPEPQWIPVSERLPDDLSEVNVTWINHNPEQYYEFTKDKPFTATAVYYKNEWYWYSATCVDYLGEYGRCDWNKVDKAIEIVAWMPLPEAYKLNNK